MCESDKNYKIQRVKWAMKELRREGQELIEWNIFRKAGIRREYKVELKEDISKILRYL